jgi:hypothetical protein
MRRLHPYLITAVSMVALASVAAQLEAIPAFARKYRMSCTTCHAPFPRLKAFGESFAAAGFRMPDPGQEPKRATIDTGDPELQLLRDFPLAARMDGFGEWEDAGERRLDGKLPWALKMLSGGAITSSTSYYFYVIFEEGGGPKIEDAYLQFNRPFGLPVNLMAGQFQVCDPLFKRELRLSRADYRILKSRVGLSSVDLTYDRGVGLSWTFPGEIESMVQVVNGRGIGEADGAGHFDGDNFKNVGVRLARSLGKHARLGGFGYWGKQKGELETENRTWYLGPDLVVNLGQRVQVSVEYLERRDDNPVFALEPAGEWKTRGGFAELHFLPQGPDGKWVITGLYNKVASDDPAADWHAASLTVNRLLGRNVRLLCEAERELDRKETRLSIGFVTAF